MRSDFPFISSELREMPGISRNSEEKTKWTRGPTINISPLRRCIVGGLQRTFFESLFERGALRKKAGDLSTEFLFGGFIICEILVQCSLMVQIKGNRAVDLAER